MNDMKINLEMSADQQSIMGKVWYQAYCGHGQLRSLIDMAPKRSGYPHNGGMHSLSMSGPRSELIAWVELLQEACGIEQADLLRVLRHTDAGRVEARAVAAHIYQSPYALARRAALDIVDMHRPELPFHPLLNRYFREQVVIQFDALRLRTDSDYALVITYRCKNSDLVEPFLRIKRMPTAAGLQFAFHELSPVGESSGFYLPNPDVLDTLKRVLDVMEKKLGAQLHAAERLKNERYEIEELEVVTVLTPPTSVDDRLDDVLEGVFPGIKTFSLGLPTIKD